MDLSSIAAKDWLSLSLGTIGTALGIFNAWKTHSRDKITVDVIAKVFRNTPRGRMTTQNRVHDGEHWDGLCIEVVNTGFQPVTVDEVGLLLDKKGTKLTFLNPEFMNEERLPRRLEARSSVTVYMPSQQSVTAGGTPGAKCAYAITACGRTFKGKSPALKSLIRIGKAIELQQARRAV